MINFSSLQRLILIERSHPELISRSVALPNFEGKFEIEKGLEFEFSRLGDRGCGLKSWQGYFLFCRANRAKFVVGTLRSLCWAHSQTCIFCRKYVADDYMFNNLNAFKMLDRSPCALRCKVLSATSPLSFRSAATFPPSFRSAATKVRLFSRRIAQLKTHVCFWLRSWIAASGALF